MSEYTPSTGEVRRRYAYARAAGSKNQSSVAEFDRWLAAHDAEVRASVVAEGPEWEYGNEQLMHSHVEVFPASSEAVAKAQAWLWPVRRRRKAGPWVPVPVEQGGES